MNNELPVTLRRSPDQPWTDRADGLAQDGDAANASQQQEDQSNIRLEKRARLLENLMNNLDTVVHAEMAAIYYMEYDHPLLHHVRD